MEFTVLRKLSEGSCGEVFLVRLDSSSPLLAGVGDGLAVLKVAKSGYWRAALVETLELWRITVRGTHPHIVSLLGYTKSGGVLRGLLLEYCRGGSLGELLRTKSRAKSRANVCAVPTHATAPPVDDEVIKATCPTAFDGSGHEASGLNDGATGIPVREARRLFAQLVDALLFLESMELWHRDIKPDNVLLTSRNIEEADVKLSDFGFARRTPCSVLRTDRQNMKDGGQGSLAFMSPERLKQFIATDAKGLHTEETEDNKHGNILRTEMLSYDRSKAEVWSAGLILYEMIYGRFLFGPVRTIRELMAAHNSVQAALQQDHSLCTLSDSKALQDLLHAMLEPDPSRRAGLQDVANHAWLFGVQKHSAFVLGSEESVESTPLLYSCHSLSQEASEYNFGGDVLHVYQADAVPVMEASTLETESLHADGSAVASIESSSSFQQGSVSSWFMINSWDISSMETHPPEDDEMASPNAGDSHHPDAEGTTFSRTLQFITAWIPESLRSLFI